MTSEAVSKAVAEGLAGLGITDETFAEYVLQICFEDTIPDDEKRDIIVEFLREATEQDVESWVDGVLASVGADKERQREAEAAARQRELAAQREREQQVLKAGVQGEAPRKSETREMTKEERRARERVLAQYGYDLDEVVETEDGEVEILYKGESDSRATAGEGSGLLAKNRNADVVKEQEQARKLKAQAEHQKMVARNKELQEKQRLEKEKEKRRTQKKEKRRM
ncbi:hypothetical protein HK105_201258 [Polyrhizophydium stewartii]|uniref:Coiled-coil domain-containing protein 43 n=1 Tax=Polyrhizophydium stewartii TaxID=2732419 RepID=A0ABR4NHI1_9FUNG|nr:hypothetical protein HK105_005892 [Polyrhizophydium stewartii]